MNSSDIVLERYFDKNFSVDIVSTIDKKESTELTIHFDKYPLINSYKIIITFNVMLEAFYKKLTYSGVSEFIFYYKEFEPIKFCKEESEIIIYFTQCAYNMTRVMFNNKYKTFGDFELIFLTTKLKEDIIYLLAKADVCNSPS